MFKDYSTMVTLPPASKPSKPVIQRLPQADPHSPRRYVKDDGRMSRESILKLWTDYRYRKGELFKRMKVTTFVQLILQVESVRLNEDDESYAPTESSYSRNGGGDVASPVPSLALTEGDYGETEVISPRSTLQSVIRGVGEYNIDDDERSLQSARLPSQLTNEKQEECPFLLLDLRDSDAYNQCHITTASNYPTAMLSRSCNNYTKEMISYRNQGGKIIVMYDEDERLAPAAATTLAQRGFDNTFILSGGLKVAVQKFPKGLVTGTLPSSCKVSSPPTARKTARKSAPPQEIIPADKKKFTDEDFTQLEFYIDEALVPSDTGSRLSRATTRSSSTASSVASSRSTTSSGNPWK